jgi:hypothetical protein
MNRDGAERVTAYGYEWSVAMTTEGVRELIAWIGLLLVLLATGCVSKPVVTKVIYEDRSAWIRLEINPDADESVMASTADTAPPASATIAALLKGFQAEKDYNPGLISFATGKTYYNRAFVDPELMVLSPQLAKGLAQASPGERVAYCLAVDHSASERFITTGWAYIRKSHLYFKLVEWRTPVNVKSPAVSTSEACQIKPIPGVKTADRFFKLDYEPKTFLETFGPMGASIMNGRGEVVFKLAGLDLAKLSGTTGQTGSAVNAPNASEATGQPQPAAAPAQRPEPSREVPSKSLNRAKPSGGMTTGR